MSDAAIRVQGLHKSYKLDHVKLHVLRGVGFQVAQGEFAAIIGASGSGKSTLLHLIGLLDRPDEGAVFLDGFDASRLSPAARNQARCRDIGFVFQFYHLLPELNVLENVLLPVMTETGMFAWPGRKAKARFAAAEVLESLGLKERLAHRPKELSGGERQRVAIARALINKPKILLADEPTGNLDSKTGKQIIEVLRRMNKDSGQTILMVTHDQSLAASADQVLHMSDGRLEK